MGFMKTTTRKKFAFFFAGLICVWLVCITIGFVMGEAVMFVAGIPLIIGYALFYELVVFGRGG